MFRGAITPKIFFELYGTHIIVSGVYGGMIDYKYIAVNNQIRVNERLETSITSSMNSEINKLMSSKN